MSAASQFLHVTISVTFECFNIFNDFGWAFTNSLGEYSIVANGLMA
jgi:hypothetical protein